MDLVLFGIQGSGKGTQAKRLAEEFGYYMFEAGGELRSIVASGSDLGKTVQSYIDEGHLVPHEIIMQVVKEAILAQPADQQIIFDGIPRDDDQMNDFNTVMQDVGREFTCVHILLDKDEAVERIAGRAEQQGRADDADQEKVLRRMDLFFEKTMPVIDQYKGGGNMVEIDGAGTKEEVYDRLRMLVASG